MPDVDNLSIPMGGGAGERLPVWIGTRPSARVPDLDRNIAQSQAQMAIALWLITLAFGPGSIRNRWFESSPLQRRVVQTSFRLTGGAVLHSPVSAADLETDKPDLGSKP